MSEELKKPIWRRKRQSSKEAVLIPSIESFNKKLKSSQIEIPQLLAISDGDLDYSPSTKESGSEKSQEEIEVVKNFIATLKLVALGAAGTTAIISLLMGMTLSSIIGYAILFGISTFVISLGITGLVFLGSYVFKYFKKN